MNMKITKYGDDMESKEIKAPLADEEINLEPAKWVSCNLCDGNSFKFLFTKKSVSSHSYQVVRCRECSLVQVNPQPSAEVIQSYYGTSYFNIRSKRGYDKYLSSSVEKQIISTYEKNLKDISFANIEKELFTKKEKPRVLDIGCASGYFLKYMKDRNWETEGIELNKEMLLYGKKALNLDIKEADFLSYPFPNIKTEKYDLITLWATIEHFNNPLKVLLKSYKLLDRGGYLIISTCSYELLAKIFGKKWRFMNLPEHLYFFSIDNLYHLAHRSGFSIKKMKTYGSGLTYKKDGTLLYRIIKKVSDFLIKLFGLGDMVVLILEKE